jgi:hypothetical protein
LKVQNITSHAIDVPNGPSLGPAEVAEAETGDDLQTYLDAGTLLDVSRRQKIDEPVNESPKQKGGK